MFDNKKEQFPVRRQMAGPREIVEAIRGFIRQGESDVHRERFFDFRREKIRNAVLRPENNA